MAEAVLRFVRAYEGSKDGEGRTTIYEAAGGTKELRTGGSPAWRNNNPGNLRPSRFNKEQIGEAWGFAVFANQQAGMRAMRDLLERPMYARLALREAIFKYAPPADNNPSDNYAAYVSERSGVGLGEIMGKIGEVKTARVIEAMTAFERCILGRVKRV